MFVAHESGASLFELPSGRRMATTTIPPGWRPAAARLPGRGRGPRLARPLGRRPRRAAHAGRDARRRPGGRRRVERARRSRSPRPSTPVVGVARGPPRRRGPADRHVGRGAPPAGRGHRRAAREPRRGRRGSTSRLSSSRTGASWSRAAPPPASRPPRTRACGSSTGSGRSSRTSSSPLPRPGAWSRARGRSRARRRVVLPRPVPVGGHPGGRRRERSGRRQALRAPARDRLPRARRRLRGGSERHVFGAATSVQYFRGRARAAWSASTSRPASGRWWPEPAPPRGERVSAR